MSRFSTGRHLSLLGHLFNNNVQSQNALVGRLCYVIVLAIKRGVFFIIEQPASSIMWDHPRLKAVLEKYSDILFRCELQLGSYNYEVPKATVLIGTAPQLQHLGRSGEGCLPTSGYGCGALTIGSILHRTTIPGLVEIVT